jgi:sirohydrochlorin cobaltochelatase
VNKAAVLLCGHGSRDAAPVAEFARAAAALQGRLGDRDLVAGHLEFARPTIAEALAALAARGARRVLAIPAMLFAAGHVTRDLPREIAAFTAEHPRVEVRLGQDLGGHAGLLDAAADRVAAAMPEGCGEALLLVVGRGTGDPDANADVARAADALGARLGCRRTAAAFAGVAHPRVDAALDAAAGQGFRRVVVVPYFLFGGVLVQRVREAVRRAERQHPNIAFAVAEHLGGHDRVIDALADRVFETERNRCSTFS